MSFEAEQHKEIEGLVSVSLNKAESAWRMHGYQFMADSISAERLLEKAATVRRSDIPGFPFVEEGRPKVGQFVALAVDMRDSTKHLKTVYKNLQKNGFERIFFEVSGLIPAISKTISYYDGVVTEYLGDGVLALFLVEENNEKETIRRALGAARNCIGDALKIVNNELYRRYSLPRLDIGAGIALSQAMVSLVGYDTSLQAKVTGNCVWEASKLCGGRNSIYVSRSVYAHRPKSPYGKLKYNRDKMKGLDCYKISRGSNAAGNHHQ